MNILNLIRQFLLIAILFVLILPVSHVFSQAEIPYAQKSSDAPLFDIDAVNFASENPALSRLDLFVKIINDELQFIKSKKGDFIAEYEISAVVFDKAGEQVDEKIWKEQITANNFDETNSRALFRLSRVSFNLPPNEYQISVGLQDLETLRTGFRKSSIILRDYSKDELSVSDILYLDQISFGENGKLDLHPKVSSERHEESKLYAYYEVYNIPPDDSVKVTYEILGLEKTAIQKSEYWLKSGGRVTGNFVEIEGKTLLHGTYRTKFVINSDEKSVSVERPFKWYWSGIPISLTDINDAIEKLRYIATKEELNKLKKAKEEDKREKFIEFWKLRDPTPGTHENELMEEYYRRIQFASEHFSGFKEGWETDMGMVYVELGPPDVVERNPFNQDFAYIPGRTIKSLEVWVYYQHNRQFIFVDENGFGEYRLANPQSFYDIINRY